MGLLDGKVAIVTGAGRGIGREEALLLAKEGAAVVVNDLGASHDGSGKPTKVADEVVEEIKKAGGKAAANYDSVSDFNKAKQMIDQAVETFGHLNILVNNAGILRDRMIFNMTEDEFDQVMGVHVKGTWNMTRHACAYWRKERKAGKDPKNLPASIINTTSDAGLLGNAGQSNYGTAKAAIAGLTIITALDVKKYKIRANAIAPQARTRLTTDATPSTKGIMESTIGKPFDPLDPAHVAPFVIFLASDAAARISGRVFRVVGNFLVFLKGWHTVDILEKKEGAWTASDFVERVDEIRKKIPKPENIQDVFSKLLKI
ncbi:MAG: SDR family NAD(P)-dependent oxidoreductase [Candidatus Helarchaeota archaeon]|nr:SDR family NAD(P)-dependent oxidoreductase [Candidatus Helarchaeota archaeon]